jgi:ABC-type glycerol-3-phosphate transport system permease component
MDHFQVPEMIEALMAHPLLALAVTLGALTAYGCSEIAARKGRSDLVWATLGLLFGVVPLIVLVALPRRPTAESS